MSKNASNNSKDITITYNGALHPEWRQDEIETSLIDFVNNNEKRLNIWVSGGHICLEKQL